MSGRKVTASWSRGDGTVISELTIWQLMYRLQSLHAAASQDQKSPLAVAPAAKKVKGVNHVRRLCCAPDRSIKTEQLLTVRFFWTLWSFSKISRK